MAQSLNVFDSIRWPKHSFLQSRAPELWKQNVNMVQMLCSLGTVVKWFKNETQVHIPQCYKIDEVTVEFLPQWGYYRVGDFAFDIRSTTEEIQADITAVKTTEVIKARGGRIYITV